MLVAGVQVSSRIFMVWLVTHSIKPVSDTGLLESTWASRKAFLLTGTQNINLTIFQEAEPLAKEGLGLDVSGIVRWLSAFIECLWNTSKPLNWHFYSHNILSSGVLQFLKSVFLCSMLYGSLEGERSLGENGYIYMYGWVALPCTWSHHSAVNQLYSSIT